MLWMIVLLENGLVCSAMDKLTFMMKKEVDDHLTDEKVEKVNKKIKKKNWHFKITQLIGPKW